MQTETLEMAEDAVTVMPRVFMYSQKGSNESVPLTDPSIHYTPEQVCNHYSFFYPELTTAKVEGPVFKDDAMVYEFVTTIGTKG